MFRRLQGSLYFCSYVVCLFIYKKHYRFLSEVKFAVDSFLIQIIILPLPGRERRGIDFLEKKQDLRILNSSKVLTERHHNGTFKSITPQYALLHHNRSDIKQHFNFGTVYVYTTSST